MDSKWPRNTKNSYLGTERLNLNKLGGIAGKMYGWKDAKKIYTSVSNMDKGTLSLRSGHHALCPLKVPYPNVNMPFTKSFLQLSSSIDEFNG